MIKQSNREVPSTNALRYPGEKGDPTFLDDSVAIALFATAMMNKMILKSNQGYGGWWDGCSIDHLRDLLLEHVKKGDMVDIANFAMMIWHREAKG